MNLILHPHPVSSHTRSSALLNDTLSVRMQHKHTPLPKARVKFRSLGDQVFPQWRSVLKQKNNNQHCLQPLSEDNGSSTITNSTLTRGLRGCVCILLYLTLSHTVVFNISKTKRTHKIITSPTESRHQPLIREFPNIV
jgi:hypothetical protein